MTASIFVPIIGQYENIGDIILRRPLVKWLRPLGTLHLFVGKAPAGFVRGLGVESGDVVYESFSDWYRAALAAALRGEAHYAFKPGEIQLTLAGMKEHVSVLPLLSLIRLRGGRVVRIGSGARNFAPLPRALMRPSVALSELLLWRDGGTAAYMGRGEVMPDLGFGDGDPPETMAASAQRDVLVVSMRGDREGVRPEWVQAVGSFARRHGLKVVAVTQVLRDSDLSRRLAAELGGDVLDWDGEAHDVQEERLRALYRHTRTVVSDRLHVLISAYTHGALPIAPLTNSSDKIARHFAAAGLPDVSFRTAGQTAGQIEDGMERVWQHQEAIAAGLPKARTVLEGVRQRVAQLIGQPQAALVAPGSETRL